ncbi:MAG: DUF1963 domain-containing protein [Oscillospiraceae bacterium]|nr:DUF1963 domain-containing protein [Oscillospiraceae bacterium]
MRILEEILRKTDNDVPPLPILRLMPVKGKGSLFDSKLGGTPYFPKNMEYPTGISGDYEGKPLRLLVQLNFEQLPHIEDFPQKGILQIFLACENDAVYGFDFVNTEDQTTQNGFRIVYHKDIITDVTQLISDEDVPTEKFSTDEYDFPIKKEFVLKAEEPALGYGTPYDVFFSEAFLRNYNESSDEKASDIYELDGGVRDLLYTRNPECVSFIGGYPVFSQYDPREDSTNLRRFDRVLFELLDLQSEETNSWGGHDYDIIWGDVGTGSFLIPSEKLRACDFSDVLYNYDCG